MLEFDWKRTGNDSLGFGLYLNKIAEFSPAHMNRTKKKAHKGLSQTD